MLLISEIVMLRHLLCGSLSFLEYKIKRLRPNYKIFREKICNQDGKFLNIIYISAITSEKLQGIKCYCGGGENDRIIYPL